MNSIEVNSPDVDTIFDGCDEKTKAHLLHLRQLILEVAAETEGVGEVEETLKWGQPSYLTPSKSGSTIRIDEVPTAEGEYAMYFHCRTSLVDRFRQLYPTEFEYEGYRAIHFNDSDEIPVEALKHCIELALTYHLRKNMHSAKGD